jgi:hypothetical protein
MVKPARRQSRWGWSFNFLACVIFQLLRRLRINPQRTDQTVKHASLSIGDTALSQRSLYR